MLLLAKNKFLVKQFPDELDTKNWTKKNSNMLFNNNHSYVAMMEDEHGHIVDQNHESLTLEMGLQDAILAKWNHIEIPDRE